MKIRRSCWIKRFTVWLAICSLVVTLLPGIAPAAENPAYSLEQAIQIVKTTFQVPEELTKFSTGYNQYNGHQAWTMNWSSKENGSSMSAEVDTATGDILNMNAWLYRPDPQPQAKLPAITREEAVSIAKALASQLQPQRMGELSLLPGEGELLPLVSWGPATYNLKWQRLINGIPFPQDGISISVDTQTGKVTSYNFRWTKGEFPDPAKAITKEQAETAFLNAKILQLEYYRAYPREMGRQNPVLLVYRLNHPSSGVIDALTGEPVDIKGGWFGFASNAMDKGEGFGGAEQPVPLTPAELNEVSETAKLISQDAAEAEVRKWVTVPEDLPLRNVNLYNEEWSEPSVRTWNFSWSSENPEPVPDKYTYISGQVNAVTGELLGFSRGSLAEKLMGDQEVQRINRDEAQKIAEDFLAKIQPQRFQQVKFQADSQPYYRPVDQAGEPPVQHFSYLRLVNGVTFPRNGLSVAVDTYKGEVNSYNLNWSEIEFPPADGVIAAADITSGYLSRQPLALEYVVLNKPDNQQEFRLVYHPVIKQGSSFEAITDAKTGEALDSQGKPLSLQPRPYNFADAAGHWANKEISLVGQAGLFGEYGDAFHPSEKVTAVQILRAMLMAVENRGRVVLSDEQVLEQARQRGWIKENLKASDPISRQALARLVVRYLGLDRAARIQGIYNVSFTDAREISTDTFGYVALSWGLGILRGDGPRFRPADQVSRAEAAVTLVRLLTAE